ncbi:MAG: iron uptake system component EfeO [Actinomycetota bacterium]|jgi:iron uptake system component EfeO|nr:iron uptake system component EfeO [Actinomycetota bacterium]
MNRSALARSSALLAAAVALALTVSACATGGSSTSGSVASVAHGASQVSITLANKGGSDVCTLSSATAKAGPVTFTVKNESSTAISEVELLSAERILGEKENLAPGLGAVSFTVTLTGGKYQVFCPGAEKQLTSFTVTGKTATVANSVTGALASGIKGYAAYVTQEVTNMISATNSLKTAVDAGDIAGAQKAYALARPYYERVESDVDGFILPGFGATDNAGNLDYLIDMRASNLDPAVGWHGFHAVERDLFEAKTITTSTKQLTAELATNVQRLDALTKSLTYKPEDLANGASDLLEEVQSNKITGEEEAYSHVDLVDFAANVEGAQQAFAYLEPGLTKIDPSLTKEIVTQFGAVNTLLDKYKDPTALGGYVSYTSAIRASDGPGLSASVEALHESLATIAAKVATA